MIKNLYPCSQQNLYDVCRAGWNACTDYLADFTAFKAKYVAAYITAQLTEVDNAELLPDEEQRIEESMTLRVNLKNKATDGMKLWQRLKRYITEAYPADQLEIKLNAAGQAHYSDAGKDNWAAAKRLLLNGNAFILANTAALSAGGNMPPAFAATFTTAKADFDTNYQDFIDAGENDEVNTQTKIQANNAIYETLISMFLDGQEIFDTDEAVRHLFTFDQVLLNIAGPGIAGARGLATNSATGQPMTVPVTIQFTGPTNKTVTTDEDARFKAEPMAEGTYIAIATATGFQDLQITNIQIEAGTMKTLNITLVPQP